MIIEILHQNCPHNCKHCFLHPTPRSTEERAIEIAQCAATAGYKVVMRPAAGEQSDGIRLLKKFGAPGGIVPLKDRFPDQANQIPDACGYEFSLHGHTEELHRLIVGESGNFKRTIRAIKKAVAAGMPGVFVNHVLHRENYRHIEDFYEFTRALGLSSVVFIKLNPALQARERIPELVLELDDLEEIICRLHQLRRLPIEGPRIRVNAKSFGVLLSKRQYLGIRAQLILKRSFQSRICVCGDGKVTVNAGTGDVFPCRYFAAEPKFLIGRWDSDRGLMLSNNTWCLDRPQKVGEPCRSCSILRWCGGGCKVAVIAEHLYRTGEYDPYVGHEMCPVANRFWV